MNFLKRLSDLLSGSTRNAAEISSGIVNVPASELQIALNEYQEWGDKLRTPREVRIAALLPNRTGAEVADIMNLCKRIEQEAWEMAAAVTDRRLSEDKAVAKLQERFPFMSRANLQRTMSQAMYYANK